ncbi:MAG: DUF1449 family protein [Candidatus Electrothrix sp. AR5]|nr:DUF1449 family protein [Candidatus Electrothrix sp. AR5]
MTDHTALRKILNIKYKKPNGDMMLTFLAEPANLPFSVSLAVMIAFVLLEVISLSLGAGLSGIIDALLPELHLDADLPDSSPSTFTQILSWFRIGKVPLLMLFLVALTTFGISGLLLQSLIRMITGNLLPPLIAVIPACFCAVPFIRVIGGLLNTYMPKDETWAVSEDSLIGKSAIILAGTASQGKPIQAKVRDEHQHTHYILVEPELPKEKFNAGETVIVSSKEGAIFQAVREQNGGSE